MTLKKQPNETQFEYIKRLTEGKRDHSIDIDYSEWSFLAFNKEYSSDVARRMFYGVEKILYFYEEHKMQGVNDTELLEKIERKKHELDIMKVQYQDQRREYNKYLKSYARWEHLIEVMNKAICSLEPMQPIHINTLATCEEECVEASLLLSDWHLYLECNNFWNKFDIDIARARIQTLKEKVIKYVKLHNVQILHIEILGDMINGAIHLGTRVESEEDVITQTIGCAEIIADFVHDLAKEVCKVRVHTVNGNHGRVTANKKESIETENFERIITWFLKERIKSVKNVTICYNLFDNTISHYKIKDKHIFSSHGHLDNVNNVISQYSQMFKIPVDEVHLGHFHSYYEKEEYGSSVVVNGTLSGTDTYAKNIRKVGKPMQVLRIYDTDVCTYKIEL